MRFIFLLAILAVAAPAHAQDAFLSLKNDAAAGELIFEIGPLHLEANAAHGGVTQPKAQGVALPFSGFLHGFSTEMIDAEGNPIPATLLHHVNVIAPQRRELFSQIMQRVAAAGAETDAVRLPKVIGYPFEEGDSLLFTAMFHNPTATDYHNVRLRVRMPYSRDRAWYPRWVIQPFYIDVMPPAGFHAYDLPPGRSEKSWEGKPAVAGRVLRIGGHMHRYGVALRLEDVTANKLLWEAVPEFDEEGNVKHVPRKSFLWRGGLELRPDHTYRLTAIYDNPTGQTISGGGMGTLGGVIVPVNRQAWPVIDRTHEDYLADLKVTHEGSHGAGHESHSGH